MLPDSLQTPTPAGHQTVSWRTNSFLAFVFGVIFISVLLFVALKTPDPTSATYATLRTILALAAAGIGGVLPGFLEVSYRQYLRAGGALALFVIVYFFSPAPPAPIDTLGTSKIETPTEPYEPLVKELLYLIDNRKYDDLYDQVAAKYKVQLSKSLSTAAMDTQRTPLGRVIERRVMGASGSDRNPTTGDIGPFRMVTYQTKFENGEKVEQLALVAEGPRWRFYGYNIFAKP